jgi:hypothetical protein
MSALDLDALRATPLERDPYDFIIVPGLVKGSAIDAINRDFPRVDGPGLFPVDELEPGPAFQALLEELDGPEFEAAMAEKFGVALEGLPTMFTVRGRCRERDGKIHTDTESKVVTVLIYLNRDWSADGGRLRVLRGPDDLDDMVAEVPPLAGTLLAFRRSERSWHGHAPFAGERRAIQMNWVTAQKWVDREVRRHRMSARLKRLNPFA